MTIVVGSGPSAVAAIHALVEAGQSVQVLDVGKTLEPALEVTRSRMSSQTPDEWSHDDVRAVNGTRRSMKEPIHTKLNYGSSFATDSIHESTQIKWNSKGGFNTSYAKGGLSNIWGSALLPYRQEDIGEWPISISDLDPHYRAVMKFVPGTQADDNLETLLPSRASAPQTLIPSGQGRRLLGHLERSSERLGRGGITFGRSRVAVDADGFVGGQSCTYCGLCLAGCPYQLIYSSGQTLDRLVSSGKVFYRHGVLVDRVKNEGGSVKVFARELASGVPLTFSADRVLLASGTISTARIVLESLGAYETPIRMLDSQYFIVPLAQWRKTKNVSEERLHTLAQAFLEIDDPSLSRHLIHIQTYGYSRFLETELNATFLRWPLKSNVFREEFLGRLLIAQGFLHSSDSGALSLRLMRDHRGMSYLDVSMEPSPRASVTIFRTVLKLFAHSLSIGAIPLVPGIKVPAPGSGYHSGGTFPMSANPKELESDTLGQIPGLARVHIVDSSIFPSIPATSITFTIMANAHRIASILGAMR